MTTEPSRERKAEIADKAAEVVDTNGHHRGYLYDEAQADEGTKPAECRVDAVGAVNVAVFGQPCWPSEEHPERFLAEAVVVELEKTIKQPAAGWNDAKGRQKRQVVKALRDTAASLRQGVAK